MRIIISGRLSDGVFAIDLTTADGETGVVRVPIEVNHPVIVELLQEQWLRPIPFRCFLTNSPDTGKLMQPFVYRSQVVGVTAARGATREEILLRVKKAVLTHESEMEKLRKDVTIMELTAPPPPHK